MNCAAFFIFTHLLDDILLKYSIFMYIFTNSCRTFSQEKKTESQTEISV